MVCLNVKPHYSKFSAFTNSETNLELSSNFPAPTPLTRANCKRSRSITKMIANTCEISAFFSPLHTRFSPVQANLSHQISVARPPGRCSLLGFQYFSFSKVAVKSWCRCWARRLFVALCWRFALGIETFSIIGSWFMVHGGKIDQKNRYVAWW